MARCAASTVDGPQCRHEAAKGKRCCKQHNKLKRCPPAKKTAATKTKKAAAPRKPRAPKKERTVLQQAQSRPLPAVPIVPRSSIMGNKWTSAPIPLGTGTLSDAALDANMAWLKRQRRARMSQKQTKALAARDRAQAREWAASRASRGAYVAPKLTDMREPEQPKQGFLGQLLSSFATKAV